MCVGIIIRYILDLHSTAAFCFVIEILLWKSFDDSQGVCVAVSQIVSRGSFVRSAFFHYQLAAFALSQKFDD